MLLKEEKKIFELLKEYVTGKIAQKKFTGAYSQLLPQLEASLDEGLYHPLNVIVPTEDNSDSAWKDNMRSMYLREIKNLDKLEDEPSYTEKLTEEKQKELCREAIEFIPKAALDRSSKEWIEETLIEDEGFLFVNEQGKSNFAKYEVLYKAKLVRKSFIMSAFSEGLPKLDYDYALLIETLKKQTDSDTLWVRCSEPDGFALVENTPWYTDTDDEIENLNWLEYTDPQSTQWDVCHLLFMPSNREWMLVHSNDFEEFSITLHGSSEFLGEILTALNDA